MTDEHFHQLLQLLVDKPMANMQLSIFTGEEGEEDLLSWLNKFELKALTIIGLKKSRIVP